MLPAERIRANHLGVPFVQEVIAVSTSLQKIAPQTDVAIELGGEDAKIIYFEGGNIEQRMNGICAGYRFFHRSDGIFQTDATGLMREEGYALQNAKQLEC